YGMAPAHGSTRRRSNGRAPLAPPPTAACSAAATPVAAVAGARSGRAVPAIAGSREAGSAPSGSQHPATAATAGTVAPAATPASVLRGLVLRLLPLPAREDGRGEDPEADRRSRR